jgi:hypothetical protein
VARGGGDGGGEEVRGPGVGRRQSQRNSAVGFLDGLGEIIGDALDVRPPSRYVPNLGPNYRP